MRAQEKEFRTNFPPRSELVHRNYQPRPGQELQQPWNTYRTVDEHKKVGYLRDDFISNCKVSDLFSDYYDNSVSVPVLYTQSLLNYLL